MAQRKSSGAELPACGEVRKGRLPYIGFTNQFMFGRVMGDERICAEVIEAILGIEVERIDYANREHFMEPRPEARGVRLDVYVKGAERVYDIEMQCGRDEHLGKRFRYYQSAIDSTLLEKGQDYEDLPESFVIFLCGYDSFGRALPVYTIERSCMEDAGVEVGSHAHWLVLNALAWDQVKGNQRLRDLLHYTQDGAVSEDALVQEIDAAVESANSDREWVSKVTWSVSTIEEEIERRTRRRLRAQYREEGLAEGRAKGRVEGRAEGEDRMGLLYERLVEANRESEYLEAIKDQAIKQKLMTEFGIA